MQDLLTVIASSSNPRNALAVLRRLAVIALDDEREARALAAAKELEQQMDPKEIPANNEAHNCDTKRNDWYIGEAMGRLVEGEADEAKRAQFRDITEAFAAFYDEDGSGDPWGLVATLDFVELSPAEFNEAKRIADRLDSMRAVLNDAKRLADKSPAARDMLAPTLSVLEAATAEAYELGQGRLRPAWAALQSPQHMTPRGFMDAVCKADASEGRAQAPAMRGG